MHTVDILYSIFFFLLSYLLGSLPTAFLVTKKFTGRDIREGGTKNVGALNVLRLTGKIHLLILTAIGDVGKGALSILIPQNCNFLGFNLLWATTAAAFGVILGHCFSIYFFLKDGKFSGGKAQASLIGVLSVLSFKWLLLPWAAIALLFVLATQIFFFGQFMGIIFLPIIAYSFRPEYFWLCVLMAIPILSKQWPHLLLALKGERPKWYLKEKKGETG